MKNRSHLQSLRLEYWQVFFDYAFQQQEFCKKFSPRKVPFRHYYDIGIIGTRSYFLCLTAHSRKKELSTGIYIPNDKHLFGILSSNKSYIESKLTFKIDWNSEKEGSTANRLRTYLSADIETTRSLWNEYFDWHVKSALVLCETIRRYGA